MPVALAVVALLAVALLNGYSISVVTPQGSVEMRSQEQQLLAYKMQYDARLRLQQKRQAGEVYPERWELLPNE